MADLIKKIRTSSGDLQIDYNSLANKPELGAMFSNPNLLINSDFRNPVNQRGKTVYEEQTERYGIDRWLIYNGIKEEVHYDFITLKNTVNFTSYFGQKFEFPLYNYSSYVITLDVGTLVGNINVTIGNQTETTNSHTLVSGVNVFYIQPYEMTSSMDQLMLTLEPGAEVNLGYIKLEQGSIATPFASRSYGEELLLCKRFYQVTKCYRTFWTDLYNNEFVENVPYGIDMRAIPRVTANITDSYNVTDLSVSDGGDVCAYRVACKPTESGGIGHRFEMYVIADAEIY